MRFINSKLVRLDRRIQFVARILVLNAPELKAVRVFRLIGCVIRNALATHIASTFSKDVAAKINALLNLVNANAATACAIPTSAKHAHHLVVIDKFMLLTSLIIASVTNSLAAKRKLVIHLSGGRECFQRKV